MVRSHMATGPYTKYVTLWGVSRSFTYGKDRIKNRHWQCVQVVLNHQFHPFQFCLNYFIMPMFISLRLFTRIGSNFNILILKSVTYFVYGLPKFWISFEVFGNLSSNAKLGQVSFLASVLPVLDGSSLCQFLIPFPVIWVESVQCPYQKQNI